MVSWSKGRQETKVPVLFVFSRHKVREEREKAIRERWGGVRESELFKINHLQKKRRRKERRKRLSTAEVGVWRSKVADPVPSVGGQECEVYSSMLKVQEKR